MVTRILLDPRRDLPGGNGFTSDPIVLEATPTSIREDGSVFVLPTTLSFTVNTAADVIQLPPPAASWAWRLVARQDGIPVQQRTVRFPDVPSIGYADLTDVNPTSLGETRGHARQWDATFFQLVTLIGQLQDEVAALTVGAPGAFNTFLEVANQIGLDETTITALQALVAGKANTADIVTLPTGGTNGQVLGLVNGVLGWVTPSSTGTTTPTLTNTVTPTISGTAQTGSVLTASTGTWSASPDLPYAYQWQRAGVTIAGATASSYTLTSADVGQAVRVLVTASKTGYTSASAPSSAVTPSAPTTGVAVTDNGDGTFSATGITVTDLGGGIFSSTGSVTDNGDGTFALAA